MRIVITGMGVVSAIGLDVHTFWSSLCKGISGLKPISLFDASEYRCRLAAEITHFDPTQFVSEKSINKYDRIQLLDIAAVDQAWENAGFNQFSYQPEELGIVLGSTYGCIESISSFYRESLKEGPMYVSPIHFSNTVMNAPAGRIAIRKKITGLCSTIATGETSGIDAMSYAYDFIQSGKCKSVLVGAGNSLCQEVFMGFYHAGGLSKSRNGQREFCIPFDKRGNGAILGEGAAVLVFESLEHALKRNAHIFAEVKGFGGHVMAKKREDEKANVQSAIFSMKTAIEDSGISLGDISMISASANSNRNSDFIEATAIKELFGEKAADPSITAIKSMIGECLDASSAMQTIAAACSIVNNKVPPIHNLNKAFTECELDYAFHINEKAINAGLINAFSCTGKRTSMVIAKYAGA